MACCPGLEGWGLRGAALLLACGQGLRCAVVLLRRYCPGGLVLPVHRYSEAAVNNASPPPVKVDACARCGKEQEAYHLTPGKKMAVWQSFTVLVADPVTGKMREYTRILCPDCAKALPLTEDRRRLLEAQFAALSKS